MRSSGESAVGERGATPEAYGVPLERDACCARRFYQEIQVELRTRAFRQINTKVGPGRTRHAGLTC
jgi:hypothetical protein